MLASRGKTAVCLGHGRLDMWRKFHAIALTLLMFLTFNVPVAQCSMSNSIIVGQTHCRWMGMGRCRTSKLIGAARTCCTKQNSAPPPCHMTLIHKAWGGPSAAQPLPLPSHIFLYLLAMKPACLCGDVKCPAHAMFVPGHSPPILSTKCVLNI